MKIDVKSTTTERHGENIWFVISGENEAEIALLRALQPLKPKVIRQNNSFMVDFFTGAQ